MQPATNAAVTRVTVIRADAGIQRAVLVVDHHPLYREGLVRALSPLPIRLRQAGTLMAAVDALERESFALILYGWHLPDGGGCGGLAAINQLAVQVPVIVISDDEDEAIGVAARFMGAADRITKADEAGRIRAVVSRVLDCNDSAGAMTTNESEVHTLASTIKLTRRQRDVLGHMASGQPNKRIATALGIADSTVRAHVSDILRLMHARNRTEAVVRAHRESLLPPRGGTDPDIGRGTVRRTIDSARAARSSLVMRPSVHDWVLAASRQHARE